MSLGIQKFSHVVMQVSDLGRSVEFYCGLLGLEKLFERSYSDPRTGRTQQVVGCLVGGTVVLELGADPERPRAIDGRSAPILALSVADIREAHQHLQAAGVTPLMPPTEMAPGLFMIFLSDPDGRTIELAQFSGGATCSVEYARAGNGVGSAADQKSS
ncbi:MAG: VOC family protein [Myxococcota bacterium]